MACASVIASAPSELRVPRIIIGQLPFPQASDVSGQSDHARDRGWLRTDEHICMLRESQVRLAGDFVGGSKFGTILELSRNRRRRIVVRGQLTMELNY